MVGTVVLQFAFQIVVHLIVLQSRHLVMTFVPHNKVFVVVVVDYNYHRVDNNLVVGYLSMDMGKNMDHRNMYRRVHKVHMVHNMDYMESNHHSNSLIYILVFSVSYMYDSLYIYNDLKSFLWGYRVSSLDMPFQVDDKLVLSCYSMVHYNFL